MDGPDASRLALAADLQDQLTVLLAGLRQDSADPPPALRFLSATRDAAAQIDRATRIAVDDARAAGHTWQEIGELLSVSRQAAQQRFGTGANSVPDEQLAALGRRAAQLVAQVRDQDYTGARSDWSERMLSALSIEQLGSAWADLLATTGPIRSIGEPHLVARGPFRIARVALDFARGPMAATVTFDPDDRVVGLFFGLPDA